MSGPVVYGRISLETVDEFSMSSMSMPRPAESATVKKNVLSFRISCAESPGTLMEPVTYFKPSYSTQPVGFAKYRPSKTKRRKLNDLKLIGWNCGEYGIHQTKSVRPVAKLVF